MSLFLFFSYSDQIRPEGRPACSIKRERTINLRRHKVWKSGKTYQGNETAELNRHKHAAIRRSLQGGGKNTSKERRRWAATHHRSLEIVHLAFERFINLSLRGCGFLLKRGVTLLLRLFVLGHFGDRLFLQFHLLTSCPFVQLPRSGVKFETATENRSVSI